MAVHNVILLQNVVNNLVALDFGSDLFLSHASNEQPGTLSGF
jgi:hypothetical protein